MSRDFFRVQFWLAFLAEPDSIKIIDKLLVFEFNAIHAAGLQSQCVHTFTGFGGDWEW